MNTTSAIWNDFSTPLREFIRRRVRDAHTAEDLLQDVFVRVHGKLDSLTDNDRLTAWLYRIARNVIVDHYRRAAHQELDGVEVPDDSPQDDARLNRQVGACISRFVAHLPEDYREAVSLAELEDMPQREIARRIGLSLSGTKSRIQRGRRMLKSMLLDCCRFEFDRSGNVVEYERNGGATDRCSAGTTTPDCGRCDE